MAPGRIATLVKGRALSASNQSSLRLVERLAQGDIALLLRGPVAAAGDGAIDHQIMSVDEGGFVAGEEYRGLSDVLGQARARDRLRGLVDFPHHVGCLLRRLDRKPKRLAENSGGDRARRNAVDADSGFTEFHRHAFG